MNEDRQERLKNILEEAIRPVLERLDALGRSIERLQKSVDEKNNQRTS
mgnify:CR=1 FL=1